MKPNRLTRCDLVLEGGGAKGGAHAGALAAIEEAGVEIANVAGTSAGAIVASALACGYTASGIRGLLMDTDFSDFKDWRFGRVTWDVLHHGGIYRGEKFVAWMSDVTHRKLMIDVPRLRVYAYDIERDEPVEISATTYPGLPIANAVRASMSIPLAFRPVRIGERLLVDGGLARNYPIDAFDAPADMTPRWPTIGLLLDESRVERVKRKICDMPLGLVIALRSINAAGRHYDKVLSRHNEFRSIRIPTGDVDAMDFDLSRAKKLELFDSGYKAARDYLKMWEQTGGFDAYVKTFRAIN